MNSIDHLFLSLFSSSRLFFGFRRFAQNTCRRFEGDFCRVWRLELVQGLPRREVDVVSAMRWQSLQRDLARLCYTWGDLGGPPDRYTGGLFGPLPALPGRVPFRWAT